MSQASVPMLVAAGLAVLLAVAHSWLGERYILVRLFRRGDLPRLFGGVDFTRRTLRFAWHITTIAWLGLAGVMAWMATVPEMRGQAEGRRIIAVTFAASGLIALVGSRGRHLSWIVFFAIAALVW